MTKTWAFALAVVALLAACQSAPAPQPSGTPKSQPPQEFHDEQAKSPVLGLAFWVNDAKSPMRTRADNGRDVVETQIGTGEFEVRLPKRKADVALRMVAWTDRTIFALEPGTKFDDIPFMRPGTGLADKLSGRMTLRLTSTAQNYYAGERVQQYSDDQERVRFERVNERTDLKADSIFVTAVMDHNDNGVVDAGEFEYFDIRLTRT